MGRFGPARRTLFTPMSGMSANGIGHGWEHSGPFDDVGTQRYPPLAIVTLEAVEIAADGDPLGFLRLRAAIDNRFRNAWFRDRRLGRR